MQEIIQKIALIVFVLLIIYIINNIYTLYSKLKHYPNGVFPLPIIGSLLREFECVICIPLFKSFFHSLLALIVNLNRHPVYYFNSLAHKYSGYFTFWLGSDPVIMVTDYDIAKSLLNKTEFSDRSSDSFLKRSKDLLVDKNIILANYDEELKVLRKVSIEAIRKYLLEDKLSVTVHKIVCETVEIMIKKERGKEFVPFHYIDSIVVRSLIRTSFGEMVAFDSPVINQILNSFEVLQENMMKIFASDYIPILKIFHNKSAQNSVTYATNRLIRNWYHNSLKTFNNNITDVLSHLLYSSKLRMLSNCGNNSYEKYLNESNLIGVMTALFFAASDTTHYTFKWILLLMAYYPEMQRKMREEIEYNIGEKHPDLSDKKKCHFVNAFIAETLRFRNVVPLGAFHRTISDINIGDKKIPKGVNIFFNQYFMLNDPKYWSNPEIFNPQRFINSDGCFDKTKLQAFIPFSTGKRMCIGDKFAVNLLFLTLTCLLQSTDGYVISLSNKQINLLEPKFGYFLEPKPYKIIIIKG